MDKSQTFADLDFALEKMGVDVRSRARITVLLREGERLGVRVIREEEKTNAERALQLVFCLSDLIKNSEKNSRRNFPDILRNFTQAIESLTK